MDKQKKKSNNRGAAMIIVLCIMSVFMMLSLGLLLGASTVITRAGQSAVREQCRVAAVSISKMITEELTDGEVKAMENYLRQEITSGEWASYDKKAAAGPGEVTREYNLSRRGNPLTAAAGDCDIAVAMYWQMTTDNQEAAADPGVRQGYDGAELIITVTARKEKESSRIKTSYILKCSKPEESEGEGKEVAWVWTVGAIE